MSILFIDGFDAYPDIDSSSNGLQASWILSNVNMELVTGRFDGQAVQCNAPGTYGAYFYKPLDTPTTTVAMGFAAELAEWNVGQQPYQIMNVSNSGTAFVGIGYNSNQKAFIWIGSAASPVATMAGTITPGSWHYYELEVTIGSVATMNLYIDGILVCTYTGNTGTGSVNRVQMGMPEYGNYSTWNFDDVYCKNVATREGERRVQTLVPASDASVQWHPSTGSANYSLINTLPVPASPTTYVYANTASAQDLYTVTPLVGNPTAISCVQVKPCINKNDSGTKTIQAILKSGTTTVNGVTAALSADFLYYPALFENDPNTSSAWTTTTVNNVEIGQKVIT